MPDGRIESFIAAGPKAEGDEPFEALALAFYTHRYEAEAGFRAWVDELGAPPSSVATWRSIPVVESAADGAEPPLPSARIAAFRGALEQLQRPPILADSPEVEDLVEVCGGEGTTLDERLGRGGGRSWLAARQRDGRAAVLLLSRQGAMRLTGGLDRHDLRFRLAPGSRLIVFGEPLELEARVRLVAGAAERLGLPPPSLRLTTPLAAGGSPVYPPLTSSGSFGPAPIPHWVRAHVPESRGSLAILDLAHRDAPLQRPATVDGTVAAGLIQLS